MEGGPTDLCSDSWKTRWACKKTPVDKTDEAWSVSYEWPGHILPGDPRHMFAYVVWVGFLLSIAGQRFIEVFVNVECDRESSFVWCCLSRLTMPTWSKLWRLLRCEITMIIIVWHQGSNGYTQVLWCTYIVYETKTKPFMSKTCNDLISSLMKSKSHIETLVLKEVLKWHFIWTRGFAFESKCIYLSHN